MLFQSDVGPEKDGGSIGEDRSKTPTLIRGLEIDCGLAGRWMLRIRSEVSRIGARVGNAWMLGIGRGGPRG